MGDIAYRILIVDDEPVIRSALEDLFSDSGWEVVSTCCGQDALDLLATSAPFDAILADYYMPQINGIEFLKRVNLKYPGTYCVMLTAYPFCDSVKFALNKYLHADIMTKPWDEGLVEKLTAVLSERERRLNQDIS